MRSISNVQRSCAGVLLLHLSHGYSHRKPRIPQSRCFTRTSDFRGASGGRGGAINSGSLLAVQLWSTFLDQRFLLTHTGSRLPFHRPSNITTSTTSLRTPHGLNAIHNLPEYLVLSVKIFWFIAYLFIFIPFPSYAWLVNAKAVVCIDM